MQLVDFGELTSSLIRWRRALHEVVIQYRSALVPQLLDIGLVTMVPASRMKAFEARMAADPLHTSAKGALIAALADA